MYFVISFASRKKKKQFKLDAENILNIIKMELLGERDISRCIIYRVIQIKQDISISKRKRKLVHVSVARGRNGIAVLLNDKMNK